MKELQLMVTIEEANLLLEGLGNMPFKQVFGLINKIQMQAAEQLQGVEKNGPSLTKFAGTTPKDR